MASGWNLWVWLVSVVVRRYIYYRYPHNNYYTLYSFLAATLHIAFTEMLILLFICILGKLSLFLHMHISFTSSIFGSPSAYLTLF